MSGAELNSEEIASIRSYEASVMNVYGSAFDRAGDRFTGSGSLLGRFAGAIRSLLLYGWRVYSNVYEYHNELCIAGQLLANLNPQFTLIEYEPKLNGSAKSIDFHARTHDGLTLHVDVKTIKPIRIDHWEKFEKKLQEGRFPKNVHVGLSREWGGGEIWHSMYTTRERILEHTLSLEKKIRLCNLSGKNAAFILALCGEGAEWREDALEDFVAFYRTGRHRADDPFSSMETNYIEEKQISFERTISRFASMNRPPFEVEPKRLNWDVQPPKFPIL